MSNAEPAHDRAGTAVMRVGFIGLGIMGRPMATNVLQGGFPLVAYDLMAEAMADMETKGATVAQSAAHVAQASDVVILCLPDSPDVRAAMVGASGVLSGAREGQIVVDMSTISPVVARELAQLASAQGVRMLDAPVSGGEVGAQDATLSIMVGGDVDALEEVRPVLATMGTTILHMGTSGAGQVTKACNQITIAVAIEAVAEALVLAAKAGVDPAKVREALLGGYAYSRVLEGQGGRFLSRNFVPGFKTRLQYKDLNIAMDAGRAYGAPLPATGLVHQLYGALMARGEGESDHSTLVCLLEDLANETLAGSS